MMYCVDCDLNGSVCPFGKYLVKCPKITLGDSGKQLPPDVPQETKGGE